MAVVGITGSSGFLGSALQQALRSRDHAVVPLTRAPGPRQWLPPHQGVLDGIDVVIHLAGESLATGRWTPAKKDRIRTSRVVPTHALAEAIAEAPDPPRLLSGSAVGYYGDTGDRMVAAGDAPGTGFLADVVGAWEAACDPAAAVTNVTFLRTGIVLGASGGALRQMLPPFRLGLGGPIGSGAQWMPVISRSAWAERVAAMVDAPPPAGPVDLVEQSVSQREFAVALGRALHRPAVAPMPAPMVRLLFGEKGEALLLAGQRVRADEGPGARDVDAIIADALADK